MLILLVLLICALGIWVWGGRRWSSGIHHAWSARIEAGLGAYARLIDRIRWVCGRLLIRGGLCAHRGRQRLNWRLVRLRRGLNRLRRLAPVRRRSAIRGRRARRPNGWLPDCL